MSLAPQLRNRIIDIFKKALEFDSWGQIDEATQAYTTLTSTLASTSQQIPLKPWELVIFRQVELLVMYRCVLLDPEWHGAADDERSTRSKRNSQIRIYVTDLEECLKKMHVIFTDAPEESRQLSMGLREKVALIQRENNGLLASVIMEDSAITGAGSTSSGGSRRNSLAGSLSMQNGSRLSSNTTSSLSRMSGVSLGNVSAPLSGDLEFLLEAPLGLPGNTFVKITLDRIGLKDSLMYQDPFLEITLVDSEGQCLEQSQRTAPSSDRGPTFVRFSTDVFIQTPVNSLPEGSAIFFEFKHYKPKKKKISTRCYAFLPAEKLQNGQQRLKLWRKPTQWKRKKLKSHSKKSLFLDIEVDMLNY